MFNSTLKRPIWIAVFACTLFMASCKDTKDNKETKDTHEEAKSLLPEVESGQLFIDVTNDNAVASKKYLKQNLRINNLIYYDSYIDDNKKRILLCVPFDVKANKIGYGAINKLDYVSDNPARNTTFMWLPAQEKKLMGKYNYYYNGDMLQPIFSELTENPFRNTFEILKNRYIIYIQLENPEEYSKLTYPDVLQKPDQVFFKNTISVEGLITELENGYVTISNCKLIKVQNSSAELDNKVKAVRNNSAVKKTDEQHVIDKKDEDAGEELIIVDEENK